MRALVLSAAAAALCATPLVAQPYADYGKPEQCGAYAEARYDRESYFPGGEGGAIRLDDPQSVRGLNVLLFEGTMTEEGMSEPVGRVLAARAPLLGVEGEEASEVVVIMTERGIRLLQPCPAPQPQGNGG
ncbi:hypothetical protein [Pseudotabrizicola algicola]|uniref:Uncharacterized protein n=1 Tax=Pseudotabrizicola algicola TaxID=2709381 RepID=A0A6B3RJW7_9RHOB|nr:hypothetical protein [Pseudotabrizicola algicola]NEX44735.1 hypothetical protein [Pseudotabrizicola algicola]